MHGKRSGALTLTLAAVWIGSGLAQTGAVRRPEPNPRSIVPCQVSDNPSIVEDCDPPPPPVRVALLGSSTALGGGASSIAVSWAGRLEIYLRGRGFELSNVSVSGSATADSFARFDRDVRPLNPQFVILATSIANEGLTDRNTEAVAARYLDNTRKLIRMTEGIGAVPILITPYPNDTYSAKVRATLMTLSSQFEGEGVVVWDFLNSVDDGNGRWIDGLSRDGLHPNDAGHLHLFDTIPVSFFEMAVSPVRWPPTMAYGSWTAGAGDGTVPSIRVGLPNPAMSWSVAFWMKPGLSTEAQPLLTLEDAGVKLQRSGTGLEIVRDGTVLGAAELPSLKNFTHLCLTYQKLSGTLTLYLNGTASAVAAVSMDQPAGFFRIRSTPGAEGESFCRMLVYRSPLNAEDVKDLVAGRLHFKSLEADLPLTESPARRLVNRAETIVLATVDGTWTWTAAGPRLGLID